MPMNSKYLPCISELWSFRASLITHSSRKMFGPSCRRGTPRICKSYLRCTAPANKNISLIQASRFRAFPRRTLRLALRAPMHSSAMKKSSKKSED